MRRDWTFRPLGELVNFASGGTPSKHKAEYWIGDIPWISAKSLKNERIKTSDLFISEDGLNAGSKLAPCGSILLLTRGSGLFNGIPVGLVEKEVAFNQDIKCLNARYIDMAQLSTSGSFPNGWEIKPYNGGISSAKMQVVSIASQGNVSGMQRVLDIERLLLDLAQNILRYYQ